MLSSEKDYGSNQDLTPLVTSHTETASTASICNKLPIQSDYSPDCHFVDCDEVDLNFYDDAMEYNRKLKVRDVFVLLYIE